MVYVLGDKDDAQEVELESIDVGSGSGLPKGLMKFVFEGDPPDQSTIALGGVLEVAGVYIAAAYRNSEFCRVGWYIRNEYDTPELEENPPEQTDWAHLRRVFSDKSRVT